MDTSPLREQLDQAMERLGRHRDRVIEVRAEMERATASHTSKDRSVTAVVGAQGRLRELKFNTEAYRTMAPAELSAAVVAVVEEARKKLDGRITGLIAPLTGEGAAIRASMTGGTELDELLGPLRAMRDSVNGRANSGAAGPADDEEEEGIDG